MAGTSKITALGQQVRGKKSVFVLIESDGAHRYLTLKVDDNEEKEKKSK